MVVTLTMTINEMNRTLVHATIIYIAERNLHSTQDVTTVKYGAMGGELMMLLVMIGSSMIQRRRRVNRGLPAASGAAGLQRGPVSQGGPTGGRMAIRACRAGRTVTLNAARCPYGWSLPHGCICPT